ncbi:hypothetical protein [Vibrio paucivorans]
MFKIEKIAYQPNSSNIYYHNAAGLLISENEILTTGTSADVSSDLGAPKAKILALDSNLNIMNEINSINTELGFSLEMIEYNNLYYLFGGVQSSHTIPAILVYDKDYNIVDNFHYVDVGDIGFFNFKVIEFNGFFYALTSRHSLLKINTLNLSEYEEKALGLEYEFSDLILDNDEIVLIGTKNNKGYLSKLDLDMNVIQEESYILSNDKPTMFTHISFWNNYYVVLADSGFDSSYPILINRDTLKVERVATETTSLHKTTCMSVIHDNYLLMGNEGAPQLCIYELNSFDLIQKIDFDDMLEEPDTFTVLMEGTLENNVKDVFVFGLINHKMPDDYYKGLILKLNKI